MIDNRIAGQCQNLNRDNIITIQIMLLPVDCVDSLLMHLKTCSRIFFESLMHLSIFSRILVEFLVHRNHSNGLAVEPWLGYHFFCTVDGSRRKNLAPSPEYPCARPGEPIYCCDEEFVPVVLAGGAVQYRFVFPP